MALSPDGSKLYVALNGSNALGVINTSTDEVEKEIPVGNAPRQVVLDGNTAYVSNEGGRPARPGETTNLSDGTPIVSSPVTGAATTGTVSVVNLTTGKQEQEIPVGLEPTALYQDGTALFVANSNDDSISLIDTATNSGRADGEHQPACRAPRWAATRTRSRCPTPNTCWSASAATMRSPSTSTAASREGNSRLGPAGFGSRVDSRGPAARGRSEFEGLLPTDWYPVQVQPDPALGSGEIVVTNDQGHRRPRPAGEDLQGPGNLAGHRMREGL